MSEKPSTSIINSHKPMVRAILHRLIPHFLHPRCRHCGRWLLYCGPCQQLVCIDCNHLTHLLHTKQVYVPVLDMIASSPLWSLRGIWNELVHFGQSLPFDRLQRSTLVLGVVLSVPILIALTWGYWLGTAIALSLYIILILFWLEGLV